MLAQEVSDLTLKNAILRARMARLCRAVSRRMIPDDPTPEDRMELREAYDAAIHFLEPNVEVTGDPLEAARESGMFVI